jgi:hypothetical protein
MITDEFLSSYVTYRPYSQVTESDSAPSSSLGSKHNTVVISKLRTSTKIIRSMTVCLSPEIILPFPKARPRKTRGRKGKNQLELTFCCILKLKEGNNKINQVRDKA